MEMDKILQVTQQWAKANGLDSVNTEKVLQSMPASNFITFTKAMESKEYETVSQLYHQAEASLHEAYEIFSDQRLMESDYKFNAKIVLIKSFPFNVLAEAFQKVPGAPTTFDQMSTAAMQTQYLKYMCEWAAPEPQSTMKPFGSDNTADTSFQSTQHISPTPQQAQVQADQKNELDHLAPDEAEIAHIHKPEQVNDLQKTLKTTPAGITDPKAEKLATDMELEPEVQDAISDMDPEVVSRLAKLAGLGGQ